MILILPILSSPIAPHIPYVVIRITAFEASLLVLFSSVLHPVDIRDVNSLIVASTGTNGP